MIVKNLHNKIINGDSLKELKKIQKFWPKNYNNTVNLTWQIEIQIIKKL